MHPEPVSILETRRARTSATLLLLAALFTLIGAATAFAQDFRGIHYAIARNALHGPQWTSSWRQTDDCTLQKSCQIQFDDRLSVVFLRYKWAVLNPAENSYRFDEIGRQLDEITAAGKKVSIVIMAGKYTPAWLMRKGVLHHRIPLTVHAREKQEGSAQQWVPAPWDPAFIEEYGKVHRKLARFLRSNPRWYDAVVLVKVAGIAVHSPEIRLNGPKAFVGKSGGDPSRRQQQFQMNAKLCEAWLEIGYSEDKVLQASRRLTSVVDQAFPDKPLGMAFVPGSRRFPTIKQGWRCAPRAKNRTLNKILRQFVSDYNRRAVINSTIFHTGGGYPRILEWAKSNGAHIGLQLNAQRLGCRNPASRCDAGEMAAALNEAVRLGASFVEVHNGNIQRYRTLLSKTDKALRGRR